MLHGFTGAPSSFDAVVSRLPSQLHYRAPTLCGHGNPAVGSAVEDFEAEVDRIAGDRWPEKPALVVGYSLGARLALGLATRHPEKVGALVLISVQAGLRTDAERLERQKKEAAQIALLEQEGLQSFVDQWEGQPLFESQAGLPAPIRRVERGRRLSHTALGLAHSLRTTGLGRMPDYWPALGALRMPVELLAGARDERFCSLGRAIAGAMQKSRLTIVPDTGHNLLLERSESITEAIRRLS